MIETKVNTYPFNAQVRGMAEKIRTRRRLALRPEGSVQDRRSEVPSSERFSENISRTVESTPNNHDDDTPIADSENEENTDNQQHSQYDKASANFSPHISDDGDNENSSARISLSPSSSVEENEGNLEENFHNLSDDIHDDVRDDIQDDIQDDAMIHEFDRTSKVVDPTYSAISYGGREHLNSKGSHDSERSSAAYDESNLVDAGEDVDILSRPIDYDSRYYGSRNTSHQPGKYENDGINKTNHDMTSIPGNHETNSNSQEPSSSFNVREFKTHTYGQYDESEGPTQPYPKDLQQNDQIHLQKYLRQRNDEVNILNYSNQQNDQTDLLNNPNQRNDPVDQNDYSNSIDIDEVPYTVSEGNGTSVKSEISSDESSSIGDGNNLHLDEMADEVTQNQIKDSAEEEDMMRSFDEKHKMNMDYASSKINELKKKLLRTTSDEPHFMTETHIQNPQTKSTEIDEKTRDTKVDEVPTSISGEQDQGTGILNGLKKKLLRTTSDEPHFMTETHIQNPQTKSTETDEKTREVKVDEVPTSISGEQSQGTGIPLVEEDENNLTSELEITSVSSAESGAIENNLLDHRPAVPFTDNKEFTEVNDGTMQNLIDDEIDLELTTLSGSSVSHSLTEVLSDTNDSKTQGDNDQIQYSAVESMPSSSFNKTNSPNLDVGGQRWNYEADKQFKEFKGMAKLNQLYEEGMKFKKKKDAKTQLYEEQQQQKLQRGLNLATSGSYKSPTRNRRRESIHDRLYQEAAEKKKKESEREQMKNIKSVSSSLSTGSRRSIGSEHITTRLYKEAETKRFKMDQKVKEKEIKEASVKPKMELSTKDYIPQNKRSTNPEAIYNILFEESKRKKIPPTPPPLPPKGKTITSNDAEKIGSRLHGKSKKKEEAGKQRREEIKRAHTPRPPTPSRKINIEEANLIYERGMVFKAALELRREEQSNDPYCSPLITSLLSDEERAAEGRVGRTPSRGRVQTPLRYRSATPDRSRGETPMRSSRSRSRSRCDTPLSRLSREHNFAPRKGNSGGYRSQTPVGRRSGVPKPAGYRVQTPIGKRE